MRIRVKLTILLLLFALAPLLIAETIDAIGFRRLSARVEQQISENIARRVQQELTVHVSRTAEQMGGIRQRVVMMTRTQAAFFAEAIADSTLNGTTPNPERLYFRSADFDALAEGEIPPGFRAQPGWTPGAGPPPVVNYAKPVLVQQPATDQNPGPSAALIAHLADCKAELDALSSDLRETVHSQFIALADGTHLAFPAKGGYEGYDPRTRDWYTKTVERDAVTWIGPYADAITGEPRLTCVAPVRAPDGSLAGVTGVDFTLSKALDLLELPPELALGSSAWVIGLDDARLATDPARTTGNRILLASRASEPVDQADPGIAPDAFNSILEDLRAGRAGTREHDLAGEPSLWAFGPIAPDVGLVMVVAQHRVESLVGGVRQDLRSIATESSRLVIAVSVLVVGLCLLGAYLMGRTVSRPIRRLADAAEAIRNGDLTARVNIRHRGDELGKLARAFNEMVPDLADHMRLRENMTLAYEIQQGLLPSGPPAIPGFDVFGVAVYCDETGGDYFDFLRPIDMGAHKHGLALGDVTGHGIPAALIMTSARALLQSHARHTDRPHEILQRMNETIARESVHGKFMTFVLLVMDTESRTLEVANAGHDPALILRARDGSFEELPMGGLPLGIVTEETYETESMALPEPGDVLLVGTDGIWETRNPQGELYGKARMREIVRTNAGATAKAIGDAILEDLKAFRGNAPVLDDITFIIAKAEEPAGPVTDPDAPHAPAPSGGPTPA